MLFKPPLYGVFSNVRQTYFKLIYIDIMSKMLEENLKHSNNYNKYKWTGYLIKRQRLPEEVFKSPVICHL